MYEVCKTRSGCAIEPGTIQIYLDVYAHASPIIVSRRVDDVSRLLTSRILLFQFVQLVCRDYLPCRHPEALQSLVKIGSVLKEPEISHIRYPVVEIFSEDSGRCNPGVGL